MTPREKSTDSHRFIRVFPPGVALAKVMELAIAPQRGQAVRFLDGTMGVVERVAQEERAWRPGAYGPWA